MKGEEVQYWCMVVFNPTISKHRNQLRLQNQLQAKPITRESFFTQSLATKQINWQIPQLSIVVPTSQRQVSLLFSFSSTPTNMLSPRRSASFPIALQCNQSCSLWEEIISLGATLHLALNYFTTSVSINGGPHSEPHSHYAVAFVALFATYTYHHVPLTLMLLFVYYHRSTFFRHH